MPISIRHKNSLRLLVLVLGMACGWTNAASAQLSAGALLKSSLPGGPGAQHQEVEQAIEQFKQGKFIETRTLLESAVKKDNKLPPAGVLLAQMLYMVKQPGLARAELERVVMSTPKDPEAFLLFGETAFQVRRFADAELSFTKAVGLCRDYKANDFRKNSMVKRAYSGLAGVAEMREDWARAAKFLEQLVKADKNDVSSTTRLARAKFQQDQKIGDAKGAETEAYQLLINLYKANPSTVRRPEITMGTMYQQAGQKATSAKLMKKAASEDTNNLQTQLTVARWALEEGDNALAQQCSDRALRADRNSVEAKLVAGLTARYQQDMAKARRALESAHLQSPSNLAALLQLAVVLIEDDATRGAALEYSQVASRLYPELGQATGREAAVTSAWVLYRIGRQTEALRLLQKALAGGQVSAESSYYAARILSQSNKEYAKRLLENSLKNERVFPARSDAESLLRSL